MKLHELQPAPGSTKRRIRVGRGIAAGKGKTAGRGTKGQKSRAGASIPAWFEGGQTPLHVRVPKLRGFKRRGRIEHQVVNVGRIAEYAAAGRFGDPTGKEPVTVNAEVLAAAGLVRHAERPVKVLGWGDVEVKLFVAADAFTTTARSKIEGAGGFVQLLIPEATPAPAAVEAAAPAKAELGAAAAVDLDEPIEADPVEPADADVTATTSAPLREGTPKAAASDADASKATE